jgi:hypothetical protein
MELYKTFIPFAIMLFQIVFCCPSSFKLKSQVKERSTTQAPATTTKMWQDPGTNSIL